MDARATADDMRKRVAKPTEQKKQDREAARDRRFDTLANLYLTEIKNKDSRSVQEVGRPGRGRPQQARAAEMEEPPRPAPQ
jgi:hypothetical protein